MNLSPRTRLERAICSILLLVIFFQVPFAIAARDSQLDSRSDAEITISLSIVPSIQIETVSDVRLDITDRSIDANFSKYFCVRGITSTKYNVIAYGSSGVDNTFLLANTNGEQLAYGVSYRGNLTSDNFDVLFPGIPSPVYSTISTEMACTDGASFKVTFRSQDLQAATSGLYSGALTLLVSPV